MLKMKLLSDNSEVVSYNFANFPICAKQSLLSDYPAMAATKCFNKITCTWKYLFSPWVLLRHEVLKFLLLFVQTLCINSK